MRYPSTSIASELSLPCMYASLRNILAAVLLLPSVHGRREDKLLYVPVHVGGHGPYSLAVDSGAHNSVIDPFIVEELRMTLTGTMTTTGAGAGAVALVPGRATLRFFAPATLRKPHGAVAVPLEDANHRFFMRVTIDVNGKEHVERRVRIDTGSGDSVGDEIVRKGRRVRETTLGQGLGSDYKSVSGLVDAVHIGPFAVPNVWGPATRFPAIGMEMLRRFTMTFDVPHRALYLQPNAHLGDAVPPPEH